jgi:adenine-specific DNA-methyltransferase
MAAKRKTESVNKETPDLAKEGVERLNDLFPEAVAEGKVDFEKLRATLGDVVDDRPERYSFSWAGKRDAIRVLQTPSRATLKPAPKESVDFDSTQNLFIEGDNLEVLKLLYKPYFGRVKMIYIDPPYNTGNDFVYPDNYADPLDTYLKLTDQKDSEGNLLNSNPESGGRYHSAWLSMMYPRLFLARQLLREDGLIFISIDDHEVHNLRLLMNEIFGEENFVDCIVWKKRYGGGAKEKHLVTLHEYILVYARSITSVDNIFVPLTQESIDRYYKHKDDNFLLRGPFRTHPLESMKSFEERENLRFPIKTPDGQQIMPKRQWRWGLARVEQAIKTGELYFTKDKNDKWSVSSKQYLRDSDGQRETKFFSIIDDIYTQHGTNEMVDIFGDARIFSFPKPTKLISKLTQLVCESNEEGIVLDFFSGSATTAQSIFELNRENAGNRRFILVQLPEPTENKEFPTISEIGKERIRRVIAKMKKEKASELALKERETPEDLGFKVFKLAESHYKHWTGVDEKNPEAYAHRMELFTDPLVPGWKPNDVLWEVAVKEGFGLTSKIEAVKETKGLDIFRVTDLDKDQSFLICLDNKLKLSALKPLGLKKDTLFICRDAALDDETAANLALQCRLKTI